MEFLSSVVDSLLWVLGIPLVAQICFTAHRTTGKIVYCTAMMKHRNSHVYFTVFYASRLHPITTVSKELYDQFLMPMPFCDPSQLFHQARPGNPGHGCPKCYNMCNAQLMLEKINHFITSVWNKILNFNEIL